MVAASVQEGVEVDSKKAAAILGLPKVCAACFLRVVKGSTFLLQCVRRPL